MLSAKDKAYIAERKAFHLARNKSASDAKRTKRIRNGEDSIFSTPTEKEMQAFLSKMVSNQVARYMDAISFIRLNELTVSDESAVRVLPRNEVAGFLRWAKMRGEV